MRKHVLAILITLLLICFSGCSLIEGGSTPNNPDIFSVGDSIIIENDYEITMKSTEFTQKVIPADPSTFYSTFEVNPENTFFHAVCEIKNLRSSKETADKIMAVNLLYNNQTGYLCSAAVERNGDFILSSDATILPLATETVHYLAEIPKDLANVRQSIDIQIVVNNHTLTCPGNSPAGNSTILVNLGSLLEENTTWQTYSAIALEQPIEDAGFGKLSLSSTRFTGSVEPANKGSLYAVSGTKEPDRIYLDTEFIFESLSSQSMEAQKALQAKIIYDNKYEYDSFVLVERGNNTDLLDAGMVTIDPQATETLHHVFELPQDLENSNRSLVLLVNYNGKDYYYQIRK